MDDCVFCKIVAGDIPCYKVYEDEDFLAFLDMYPVNHGHTLVIPKKHYDNIFDLPNDIASKYFVVVQKIAGVVKNIMDADGINIGMNNLPAAGQVVFHSHIHVIPRFKNDGLNHWGNKEVNQDEMNKIAEKMKESIK